jgi:deoxycytidylate deaminase
MTIFNSDERWFDLAMKTANSSICQFKHGAVIVIHNKPISIGMNIPENRNIKKLFHRGRFDHAAHKRRERSDQIHAEVHAILKAGTDLKGSTLYSARYRPKGLRGDSCPCESCAQIISLSGISTVVYQENGKLKKVKL